MERALALPRQNTRSLVQFPPCIHRLLHTYRILSFGADIHYRFSSLLNSAKCTLDFDSTILFCYSLFCFVLLWFLPSFLASILCSCSVWNFFIDRLLLFNRWAMFVLFISEKTSNHHILFWGILQKFSRALVCGHWAYSCKEATQSICKRWVMQLLARTDSEKYIFL